MKCRPLNKPSRLDVIPAPRHRLQASYTLANHSAVCNRTLKATITRVLSATWQRCRVHFMRNAMAHAGKTQRRIVSAWVGTAFAQDDAASTSKQWRQVADQLRPRVSKPP